MPAFPLAGRFSLSPLQRSPCSSRSVEHTGPPKFLCASLHAYHALIRPRRTLRDLTSNGPFVSASAFATALPPALLTLTRLYQASGRTVSPTAYVIPCVRFICYVHVILTLLTDATLGMSGSLDLTQQGLSPCKKHQALLGARPDVYSSRRPKTPASSFRSRM